MANANTGNLVLVMRLAEEKEIAHFELEDGETLSDRVKKEIAKAKERGEIKGLANRGGLPIAGVRECTEDGVNVNSVALFTAEGDEISYRTTLLSMEDGMYLLTGIDTETDAKTLLGAFPDEDLANRVGVLWKHGLI